MIMKIMGIMDFIAVVGILFAFIMPAKLLFYIGAYLIIKGGTFAYLGNIVSLIDVFCGLYALLLIAGVSFTVVTVLVLLYLAQKALFSLI